MVKKRGRANQTNKSLAQQTSAEWQNYIARITREANTSKPPPPKITNNTRKIIALTPGMGGLIQVLSA